MNVSKTLTYWDTKSDLLDMIQKKGGWVNAHAHIDRAYTLTKENFHLSERQRSEKWALNHQLRLDSTVDQIYDRMARAVEGFLAQGVTTLGSFIDVDYAVKDKAIKAAHRLRERYGSQMQFKFLNQSSYGLFDSSKEGLTWFEKGAEFVDIIGGLLKADVGREEEYLDILLGTAKRFGKMVHIHIDELNLPEEKETELLAKKTIEHGLQGKVVGIHAISLNCRSKQERERVYRLMQEAQLLMIACPMSWLNARRSEELSPIHNPFTPVDELLDYEIPVAIGTDNIADIWMPWNTGEMWLDMRALIEGCRIYDLDILSDIATVNGRKVLGIE